ncbi:MAG: hypothetical protein N2319_10525 [Candidatus Kapabacteria bacterium]|nr:hypothetical protein [Candidatus Kapabacteria bacterium]
MNPDIIYFASSLGALLSFLIAMFQVMLVLGFPYAEASWGGKYKVLPKKLRVASVIATILLIFIGFIYLLASKILPEIIPFQTTKIIMWIIVVFLLLNTIGNLASKSKYEKLFMTPISFIMLICGLILSIFG